jgi:tape measure domain-containing protein
MANLTDTIRLQTDVNLQGFVDLSKQLSQIQLSLTSVAASARNLSTNLGQNTTTTNANAASLANLTTQTNNATRANNGLFSSFTSLTSVRSQLVGLFGAFSVGAFAQQMVEAQSKVESFGLSMKNLLGAEYGAKLVSDLKQFTVETPLNFEQVIKSASQLVGSFKAAGASSKTIATEIPQILDSLGNSAAALGGDGRLGRLIYAFSQVQATGRLMGTEVRQITETGFPLLAVLTDSLNERFPKLSLSVADVQKRVSDGKVSFEDFKVAILSAGKEGGVFAGSMDIMANTVKGRIDKLKESVFFAFANIGNQFNDTAKEVINFGSNIVQALFGTESATKRTIEVLKTAITTWIAYTAATKIAAAQTVIGTAIDRVSLILRGQMILANATLTGSYNVLTLAETEATVAARAFNTTAMSNPLGLLVLGIGAVVGAYQLYNSSLEQAEENQKKLSNEIATSVAPIKTQQAEFDNLAKAVLSTSLPLSEQEKILNKLKLQYPILLKGVTDLSTAEEILNKNKHKTNSTLDFRNAKLEQLKKKYPEQLKGIDTLAEAELKLGGVVRATDRDFAILSATMENNIRIQNQVAGANDNFAKKIQAQGELAKLRSGQTGSNLVDFGGNVMDDTSLRIAQKEKEIKSYDDAAKGFVRAAEVIRAKNEELTSKLKYNWQELPKVITKTGEEGKEKALKYQADTAEQMKIASNKIIAEDMESSRQKDLILRNLEFRNQQERIKNAVGSQKIKSKLLLDLEQEYDADISKIHQTWDVRDEINKQKAIKNLLKADGDYNKASIDLQKSKNELKLIMAAKSSKEIEKIEQDTADNILELNKTSAEKQLKIEEDKLEEILKINGKDSLEYLKQDKIVLESATKLKNAEIALINLKSNNQKKATKEEEDLKDKLLKLDEDNAKESVKLENDKYKLMEKLRILQLISKAKNSEEIIKIQNRENERILKGNVIFIKEQISAEVAKLTEMQLLGEENTEEYKKQQGVVLKLNKELTEEQIRNAEFLTEKEKEEKDKRVKAEKDAAEFMLASANMFLDALSSALDDSMSKTGDIVTKAQLENQQAVIGVAKQGLSAIGSFVSGDIVGGSLKAIGFLFSAIQTVGKNTERLNAAILQKATNELNDYLNIVETGVGKLMSRFDDIKEAYGEITLDSGKTIGSNLSKDIGLDVAMKNLWDLARSIDTLKKLNKDGFVFNIDYLGLTQSLTKIDEWRLFIAASGRSVVELIEAEITRGEQIQKNYEIAVGNEGRVYETNLSNNKKVYDDKIGKLDSIKEKGIATTNTTYDNEITRINAAYDLSVKNINAKFDLEATRANQKYDAETLAILQAGSKQLEATITNEASLNSVRTEFAGKRQFILDTYALANKEITADMSQEEIAGINNAIKARDAALAKLQKWYNDELTAISTSEGQKRKEYSATEIIRNDINDRLEKAAIIFDANEITRNANKNIELAAAQKTRDDAEILAKDVKTKALALIDTNYAIAKAIEDKAFNEANEVEEKRHTDAITALNKQKDEDIATSFKILTELLKIYSQDITKAMEETTAKGSDAYKKLANQLEIVNNLLNQIKANSLITFGTALNFPTDTLGTGLGFEKGTDDTSVALKGQRVVDNKGGWQAILHPQEAVFSKADMTQMETVFGKRPTRQEVIENFKIGVVNQVTPQMNPFVIQKVQANGVGNFDKLGDKIERLAKEVSKKMSPVVYVDKGGIRTFYKNVNSQIEVKNQRFK